MMWLKSLVWIGYAAAWTVSKSAVAVSGSGDAADRVPLEQLSGPVELFSGRSLDIAFKVEESPAPHQVMVRIHVAEENDAAATPQGEYVDKTVLAKMRGKNAKSVIPFKAIPQELHNYPLKVSAIISGARGSPLETHLFDLIVYGAEDEKVSPLRQTGSGSQLAKKPLIIHQFPGQPKHVNALVALFFIGAIDALFAALVYLWVDTTKLKISLPLSRQSIVTLILLTELAFVGYYIHWSIFRLLAALGVLVPVLFVTYNHAI